MNGRTMPGSYSKYAVKFFKLDEYMRPFSYNYVHITLFALLWLINFPFLFNSFCNSTGSFAINIFYHGCHRCCYCPRQILQGKWQNKSLWQKVWAFQGLVFIGHRLKASVGPSYILYHKQMWWGLYQTRKDGHRNYFMHSCFASALKSFWHVLQWISIALDFN